ncbi:ATP-binding protein [Angustibacter sp. McL0619]|uniref:ATP-binding protein n=1 Tax=Angustibacter sp. McL0619 TaxID=3415676 RepID=UPI003CF8B11F
MTRSAYEGPAGSPDVVELEVPASAAYVAVVRTATAGLAARFDLTLDRIEDLRIAIDEACTLLIRRPADAPPDHLECVFTLGEGALTVDVTGPDVELPEHTAYAWAVLSALVDSLESGHEDVDGVCRTWIRLVVRASGGQWT